MTLAWHWQHLVAGSNLTLFCDVLHVSNTPQREQQLTVLRHHCKTSAQFYISPVQCLFKTYLQKNEVKSHTTVRHWQNKTQGEVKVVSQLYTYIISMCKTKLAYKCFKEFLHASASQAASMLTGHSSFHWCPIVKNSKFSLVLLSMKLSIYNKWNYCKKSFSAWW